MAHAAFTGVSDSATCTLILQEPSSVRALPALLAAASSPILSQELRWPLHLCSAQARACQELGFHPALHACSITCPQPAFCPCPGPLPFQQSACQKLVLHLKAGLHWPTDQAAPQSLSLPPGGSSRQLLLQDSAPVT